MPDNKPPAFQFYAGDFLSSLDVAFMDMELRGAYITLLAYSWLEYGIPDDDEVIAKILQCKDEKQFKRYKHHVIGACFKLTKDRWYNPRQERERKKITDRKENRVEIGKLGAKKRWSKAKKGGNSHTSTHSRAIVTEEEIEFENEFWLKYPRKREKKRTIIAYKKIRKTVSKEVIIQGLDAHLKGCWSGKEVKFIPYATTWLNGECWNDDASSPDGNVAIAKTPTITKICSVCGSVRNGTTKQRIDVCRAHKPSMIMYDKEKKLLDDVLLFANEIREELGLELIGEK